MATTNTTDPNLPNFTRPEVVASSKDLTLVSDLLAGTRRMHEQSQKAGYIRKWTDETDGVYDIRRTIETVFEGLGRTLSSATGMLFAKAPSIEWNQSETAMSPQWDNIDAAGTKGTVFVKRFAESSIRDGISVILVDHTPPPDPMVLPLGERTDKTNQDLGLRPTWAAYSRSQVINWRTATVNNEQRLTLIVFHECAEVETGVFGISSVHRFRVLRLVDGVASWELYEQTKPDATTADSFKSVGTGTFTNRAGKAADFLPVSIAYTGRTDSPLTSTIPLLGVAWANLAHWQLSTTLRFSAEVAGYAQGVIVGEIAQEQGAGGQMVPGKVRMGPMALIHLKGDGASFEWKAPPVEAFEPLEKRIDEKLGQMSKLGMAFLATDTRAPETAEAKRLDATAENSTLATAAQGIEDAVNMAFEFHAWYLGIDKAGAPVLTISRDYESTAMDPATMAVYITAIRDAGLPVRLLLEAWQAGGRIPPDTDLDQLELEMEAAKAAADEQKRIEAANADPFKQAA
jgi:hypothetical protein